MPFSQPVPCSVAIYGWLGLIPFLAPPLMGWMFPSTAELAGTAIAAYAALILSFLGGARWGLAVGKGAPNAVIISLAMLPSLVALALLATPSVIGSWRLASLACALVLQWFWDVRSGDLPAWYPHLRTRLTMGAIAGLLAGALVLTG